MRPAPTTCARTARRCCRHGQCAEAFRRASADVRAAWADAVAIVKDVSGESTYNDVNYVFRPSSSRTCRSAWSAC
ncbi:MAG: hypothetical protein R2708_24165 [Vicinamibacterales bacterium]